MTTASTTVSIPPSDGAPVPDAPRRRRVAILGAGPAGLAAAWGLSDESVRDRFDVSVYQTGWRAGGKSSSARNTAAGHRIEQNGSHYLFGCYHNSFSLIRQAYAELGARSPFGRLEDEFTARNLVVGKRDLGNGQWEDWFQYMPTNLSKPGEGGKYIRPFDYLLYLFQVFFRVLLGFFDYGDEPSRTARWVLWVFCLSPFKQDSAWDEWRGRLVRALLFVPAWIVNVPLAFVGARLFRAAAFCYDAFLSTYSKRRVEAALVGRAQAFALWLHDASRRAWAAISRQVAGWNLGTGWDGRVRRMAVLFEIALTAVVGVVTDRLWRPGALEAIDGEDFRGWLRRHGGTEESINSAYIKCWYDAVVAYDDGDPSNPSISAAVTLYAGFRALATYKGNFAFQMRHEVGDGVIAPLVQALVNRGVTFQFLHRVRDVVPGTDAAGRPVVQEIVLEPQLPGRALTRLFVENAAGRPVWPDSPQVAGGLPVGLDPADLESFYTGDSGARWTLRRAAVEDGFDEVVFALPVPVVPHDAGSLVQGPGWRRMVQNIKATESLSLRIWFRWSLQELGWDHPTPILSGYQFPFSTWEDNSHNITNEGFPPGMEPRAIATVFGPLPAPPRAPAAGPAGDTYLQDQRAVAAQAARDFFQHAAGHLWPKLLDANGQLQYDAFCDLRPAALQAATPPAARLDWQLLRANVGPVERYTMALPRTLQDRLRPDESGYVNMVLAGEWTRNGVEVGSVEGAMVSGLAAARALGGYPPTIPGERDLEFGLGAAG